MTWQTWRPPASDRHATAAVVELLTSPIPGQTDPLTEDHELAWEVGGEVLAALRRLGWTPPT